MKFAGSFNPRPPDTTIGASATSSAPASAALMRCTTTRPADPSTAADSTTPARGRSTGVNTLGRSEMSAGVPASLSVSRAFPAYTGRVTTTAPASTPTSVTSWASAQPSRAATRGARSFPVALAAKTTARYPPVAARSAITRAYPSGAYMPNAAFVSVITLSAPNRPSWSAPFTPPAASSKASTDPPSASASRRAPVTTSWDTLRSAPSRCSSTASTDGELTEPSLPRAAGAPAPLRRPPLRRRSFLPSGPVAASWRRLPSDPRRARPASRRGVSSSPP